MRCKVYDIKTKKVRGEITTYERSAIRIFLHSHSDKMGGIFRNLNQFLKENNMILVNPYYTRRRKQTTGINKSQFWDFYIKRLNPRTQRIEFVKLK